MMRGMRRTITLHVAPDAHAVAVRHVCKQQCQLILVHANDARARHVVLQQRPFAFSNVGRRRVLHEKIGQLSGGPVLHLVPRQQRC